jgi:hypothetical protein
MSYYERIPQDYRDLINNQYPQINDEHKKQLGELWSVMFDIGGTEQTGPQFESFLQQQIANTNNSQSISDIIDGEISLIEGRLITGGRKKRKRVSKKSKKSFRKSSKQRKNKSRKNKKSYKKRK